MSGADPAVVAEARAFLAEAAPAFRAEYGDRQDFDAARAWQRRLDGAGWVGLNWPKEYGGRALDLATQVAVETAIGETGAPQIAGFIGVNTVAAALMRWGTPEQKAYLPAIRSGELIFCQGFSEPGAGSDLASLRTRAQRVDDGFVLDGQKVWTSHGTHGDQCLVLARTTPIEAGGRSHRGLSMFLVPMNLPGVTVKPIRQLTGDDEFCEVFFDAVRLPPSALVGPLDDGWRAAMSTLAHERAAAMLLAMRTRADVRHTVGSAGPELPPGRRDEALQLYVESEVLGLLAERSIAEIGSGTVGPAQSVVKLAWSQVDQRYAEFLFDLHGAAATAGLRPAAANALLFSRSSTIAAGTTEVMRNILGEQVLGLPR
ncbi:MAG: acyl-CoA dehydrogenase family protein [Mycolicibacterium hassiacum]|uniref:acyl-CoA dehydrogenase family protein n=1 Tax=Mycolicibacterium hassiacum TaxID=46351 RepID=UPI000DB43126|nr:acyl-CoA dehydrogenase family protein [Mycolicibacterium hassiacum]MBX5488726.1 acyl-CoA dehydrogenase family protein [Mycolicibacterium hassiacum]PZN21127.1 MAG: acyl-CoA dehydrogenase [Mycolicibacterium hassiacum]